MVQGKENDMREWAVRAREEKTETGVCALTDVPGGRIVRVAQMPSDRELCSRLFAMGILPGAEIKVTGCGRPLILEVLGSRVGLCRWMAEQIRVKNGTKAEEGKP